MNNDMSEMVKNISKMMNNTEMPENIKNILNSINNNNCANNNDSAQQDSNFEYNNASNSNSDSNNRNSTSNEHSTNNIFENIDMNTIFKMQQIFNSMNDSKNDSRSNLLLSLKPYLKESRKNKVDQYIQLMKMSKIIEVMNPLGGENNHV